MHKRQFLAAAVTAATLPAIARAAPAALRGPALLTVTGSIAKPNRGPFDAVRDQMMHKQKISFERARAFDFAALTALPARTIRPTLEYDGKAHALRGPLLEDVLKAAGAPEDGAARLLLRAVDGYAAALTVAQARAAFYRRPPPGRAGDGAGRPGAAMGDSRCGPHRGRGGPAPGRTVRQLPVGAVSHWRGGGLTLLKTPNKTVASGRERWLRSATVLCTGPPRR